MCAPQAPGVGFNRMLTNICEDMIKEVFVEIKSINEKKETERRFTWIHRTENPCRESCVERSKRKLQKLKTILHGKMFLKVGISGGKRRNYE